MHEPDNFLWPQREDILKVIEVINVVTTILRVGNKIGFRQKEM